MNRLPQQLEQLRERLAISKVEIADRAEKSRSAVIAALAGERDTQLSVLESIGRALGVEFVAVPKALTEAVEHFVASGGQALAQPAGVDAPKSAADLIKDDLKPEPVRKVVTREDFAKDPVLSEHASKGKDVARALDAKSDLPSVTRGTDE